MWSIGDLRAEHAVFGLACVVLGYFGPRTKAFLSDIAPYLVVAMGYDLVRYARRAALSADRVLGCELRSAELALFETSAGTPQDYFAVHHAPALDVFFAIPYAIFAYVALVYAGYLYVKDRQRMRRYLWAFAIANYLSFATWLVFPAAPPWYIREYGCAIDLAAQPSPAALARVDALLGISYFDAFYSRAASVFGALPSMHCAYPVLGMLTARRVATARTWPLHIGYTTVMAGAAVYLDHHWIIDVLAGWLVAGVAVAAAHYAIAWIERKKQPAEVTSGRPAQSTASQAAE
jgi:membrane-associated phospholipid phosphatase